MINPLNAYYFFASDFMRAFVAMGSVVLAVTGAEALYADMGHFGRGRSGSPGFLRPARADPQLYGAGRAVLSRPADALAINNPFFLLAPDSFGFRWCCSRPRRR